MEVQSNCAREVEEEGVMRVAPGTCPNEDLGPKPCLVARTLHCHRGAS